MVVVVKTAGAGFHVPVTGVHRMSATGVQAATRRLHLLTRAAHHRFRFSVVDTWNMTLARYADFFPGQCQCHFHQVSLQASLQALILCRRDSSEMLQRCFDAAMHPKVAHLSYFCFDLLRFSLSMMGKGGMLGSRLADRDIMSKNLWLAPAWPSITDCNRWL